MGGRSCGRILPTSLRPLRIHLLDPSVRMDPDSSRSRRFEERDEVPFFQLDHELVEFLLAQPDRPISDPDPGPSVVAEADSPDRVAGLEVFAVFKDDAVG